MAIIAGTLFYFIMGDLMQEDDSCLSEFNPLVDKPIYKIWFLTQWAFWWAVGTVLLGSDIFGFERQGGVRWSFETTKPYISKLPITFCENILLEKWKPGDRIPSVREMAVSIEVNPNTVMRTFTYLQEKGIILQQKRGHWAIFRGRRRQNQNQCPQKRRLYP